jgi:hypothetical protein
MLPILVRVMISNDSTIPSTTAPPAQSRAAQLGEIVLILLVFLAVGGELTPHSNEAHYLSRLKHFWNPTWCAGDFFLESPESHFLGRPRRGVGPVGMGVAAT